MIKYVIMSVVFTISGLIEAKESNAQYYIPNQAWGLSYNQGYGSNWNNNYNNSYRNDYYARGAHNLPAAKIAPYLGGKTVNNPVTEENRYFYPQNNKSMYPPVEYKRRSPGENKPFTFPNVRGVVIPELPTYSRSAGTRK